MPENNLLIEDLTKSYYQILRSSKKNLTRMEICKILETYPAPRFYISLSYARRIIRDITCGKPRAVSYRNRDKHQEIYRRWLSLEEKTDENLQKILSSPAPSFYHSAHRINTLLYKYYDRRKQ